VCKNAGRSAVLDEALKVIYRAPTRTAALKAVKAFASISV